MSKPRESKAAAWWREIVRGQAESGLSVAAYCRRGRVPQSSFYAWRLKVRDAERLARRPGCPTFAEVRVTPTWASNVTDDAALAAGTLEVRRPGGCGIVVRPGFDRQTLLDLVAALEGGNGDVADREAGV